MKLGNIEQEKKQWNTRGEKTIPKVTGRGKIIEGGREKEVVYIDNVLLKNKYNSESSVPISKEQSENARQRLEDLFKKDKKAA